MKLEELSEMKKAYETAFWFNENYDGADCLDDFIERYGEALYEAIKELEKYLKRGKRMNRMKEVANLFGLQLDEEFKIVGSDYTERNPLKFTEKGLMGTDGSLYSDALKRLLVGKLQIKKLPFKPKKNDAYYYVRSFKRGYNGYIHDAVWFDDTVDYYCYNTGNCFRTEEEITQKDIDIILKDMKWKYEGDGK